MVGAVLLLWQHIKLTFIGNKRPHPFDEEEETEENKKEIEELWSLRDVVFLSPPLSSTPLGTVVKLDGLYAAVLFPTLNEGEGPDEEGDKSVLSHCRLLRRDDLVVCAT